MKITLSFALIIFMVWGWVNNLIDLIHAEAINGLTIARAIGVLVPSIGTFMGYFF